MRREGSKMQDDEFVNTMRLLVIDHKPDGWPAVRMSEISRLCNIIDRLKSQLEESDKMITALRYDRNYLRQALDQPGGRG